KCPAWFDMHIHVHASRTAGFGPPAKPNFFEKPLHFESDPSHVAPSDPRNRIEIDAQFVRMLKISGADCVRVQFDATQIDYPGEPGSVIHHDLFRCSARRE